MNWNAFRSAAPELADKAEALFEGAGVVLVGTVRKDGSPRLSPVEPLIVADDLYLGMMWQSKKALDLLRDPRCTVHSAVGDKDATGGEFKLHGRVRDVSDQTERHRYGDALLAKVGWRPDDARFHLFAVEVESAAWFMTDGDSRRVTLWRAGEAPRNYRQGIEAALTPDD